MQRSFVRPVIDVFWWVGDDSALPSPLVIVGGLSLLLIIVCLVTGTLPRKNTIPQDNLVGILGALLALNSLCLFIRLDQVALATSVKNERPSKLPGFCQSVFSRKLVT